MYSGAGYFPSHLFAGRCRFTRKLSAQVDSSTDEPHTFSLSLSHISRAAITAGLSLLLCLIALPSDGFSFLKPIWCITSPIFRFSFIMTSSIRAIAQLSSLRSAATTEFDETGPERGVRSAPCFCSHCRNCRCSVGCAFSQAFFSSDSLVRGFLIPATCRAWFSDGYFPAR